jgi:hypothetical protein
MEPGRDSQLISPLELKTLGRYQLENRRRALDEVASGFRKGLVWGNSGRIAARSAAVA